MTTITEVDALTLANLATTPEWPSWRSLRIRVEHEQVRSTGYYRTRLGLHVYEYIFTTQVWDGIGFAFLSRLDIWDRGWIRHWLYEEPMSHLEIARTQRHQELLAELPSIALREQL